MSIEEQQFTDKELDMIEDMADFYYDYCSEDDKEGYAMISIRSGFLLKRK